MNLAGILILVPLLLLVMFGSTRAALLSVVAGVLYLTQGQQIQIGGFNMFAVRFIELAGFARVVARREFSFKNMNTLDKVFILFYVYTTVVFVLRSNDQPGYQIGLAADAFLCYFMFRGLINQTEDITRLLRGMVFLLIPYVVLVLVESTTHSNPFSFMGGVTFSGWFREGRLRCQGSFRHPSLLGTFGATFIPLYIGLFFHSAARLIPVLGGILCLAIVWASNSGGPLNCVLVTLIAWAFWRYRTRMKTVRRCIALAVVALACVMKAPIWYLPAKVSSLSGGDGWHRSYLMDVAAQNFRHWWFAGMPIENTRDWFAYTLDTGGADITNVFISIGLNAGFAAIVIIIALLSMSFKRLGMAMHSLRESSESQQSDEYLLWALGSALLGHIVNWLGITYFDQIYIIWFLHLAAISSLSTVVLQRSSKGEIGNEHIPNARAHYMNAAYSEYRLSDDDRS